MNVMEKANYVDPSALVGTGTTMGYFNVIGAGVYIGESVEIGNHVVIHPDTVIGAGSRVGDFAVIGKLPNPSRLSTVNSTGDLVPLETGEEANIGSHVVLYRGTKVGSQVTIADFASVRERCRVGNNVVIGRGVAVENDTTIGDFTKIQTGAYITAYVTMEDHVFVAPMVTTTNDNYMGRTEKRFAEKKGATIKRGARVGGASVLLPGVVVGEEAFVAAGALVTKDVPARTVVKGFPARAVRMVPDEELLEGSD